MITYKDLKEFRKIFLDGITFEIFFRIYTETAPQLMILDICAAAMYIQSGDWRKIGYWLAAAILTFCVTW